MFPGYAYGRGLTHMTSVVTDGHFPGTNNGCFAGHISPEAAEGEPIAAVRDDNIIAIDIPNRSLRLELKDFELQDRLIKTSTLNIKKGQTNES